MQIIKSILFVSALTLCSVQAQAFKVGSSVDPKLQVYVELQGANGERYSKQSIGTLYPQQGVPLFNVNYDSYIGPDDKDLKLFVIGEAKLKGKTSKIERIECEANKDTKMVLFKTDETDEHLACSAS